MSIFVDPFNRAAARATFKVLSIRDQDVMLQSMYDDGISGPKLSKVFDVPNIYDRIDAHRGRGPAPSALT